MAAKRLESKAQIDKAVDELLASFAVPQGEEPQLQEFDDSAPLKKIENGEKTTAAPSAEVDALWGSSKRKSK
jgi:hypothetical protein